MERRIPREMVEREIERERGGKESYKREEKKMWKYVQ